MVPCHNKTASQRDALGRITAKHEERPSGITTFQYAYDPAGRLVSEQKILPDGVKPGPS